MSPGSISLRRIYAHVVRAWIRGTYAWAVLVGVGALCVGSVVAATRPESSELGDLLAIVLFAFDGLLLLAMLMLSRYAFDRAATGGAITSLLALETPAVVQTVAQRYLQWKRQAFAEPLTLALVDVWCRRASLEATDGLAKTHGQSTHAQDRAFARAIRES